MKTRKGLTLLEIIISIAILGIVTISALSIFDAGLVNVKRARTTMNNTNYVSSELDLMISDYNLIDGKSLTVEVTLPGSIYRNVEGEILESNNTDENGNTLEIEAFIPEYN